jgi:CrcB protein
MSDGTLQDRLRPLALVAAGGFGGATLRHAVTLALPGALVGTLAVNVAGSFALGVLLSDERLATRVSTETQLVVGAGFLSSFTTYSTFASQTAGLDPQWAVAYVGATYGGGFLAVVAGQLTARWAS